VRIRRIHLEEDAGKSVHEGAMTLVNLNRAGIPLIEIVSEPDLRSAAEAGEFLRQLHAIVMTLGISDGNLQEGNFRCDSNVSIRPKGASSLGTRAEIKNVNSFRFVEKAIDYEIARQEQVIRSGGRVIQETRTFDSDRGVTLSMRTKEEAEDYRYFPDPDLVPIRISEAVLQTIRESLPELPLARKQRYQRDLGLTAYDAGVITSSVSSVRFFDEAMVRIAASGKIEPVLAKGVANLLTGEIARRLNEEAIELSDSRLTPGHVVDLAVAMAAGLISSAAAKQVINAAWKSGDAVDIIIEKEGLKQVSDANQLDPIVVQALADFPAQFEDLRAGKDKVIGFLVGQIMKRTGGKANPAMIQELIRKRASS
jgi:aspartyl-tRNA(Asn)/glutamyl-tRNA(Gln) amidotransferase subunit B